MSHNFQRRHSLWYERLLFSGVFQFLLGISVVVFIPSWFFGYEFFEGSTSIAKSVSLAANFINFCLIFVMIRQLRNYPGAQHTVVYVLPVLAIIWFFSVALLSFLRVEYIRKIFVLSFVVANVWLVAAFYIRKKYREPKLAIVPIGRANSLCGRSDIAVNVLCKPELFGRRFDAVVADLHSDEIPAEWERFLAKCTLADIPVFHYKQIEEMLTGRVRIEHMAENEIGALIPSQFYTGAKRFIDGVFAILLLPFCLPIFLVTMFFIKFDSKGPVIYIQERVGFRGKIFHVYKFRSMYVDVEGKGFTDEQDDPRITRVGKFIRKFRIDELPQIFNVIKGDMSFIGPRPESKKLADWYEEVIPFFSYRHIVRPGISGWAQVNQGYAADIEGMEKKLQYDFYYIKHFSLWIDVLIFFKTIRTILTGFGAR